MAATTDSFRSSLHGFNRMDVVQFIQKTTSEHELELRRLAEERTRQQEELEQQKKELAARQEESERQKQELSHLLADNVNQVVDRKVLVTDTRKDHHNQYKDQQRYKALLCLRICFKLFHRR